MLLILTGSGNYSSALLIVFCAEAGCAVDDVSLADGHHFLRLLEHRFVFVKVVAWPSDRHPLRPLQPCFVFAKGVASPDDHYLRHLRWHYYGFVANAHILPSLAHRVLLL